MVIRPTLDAHAHLDHERTSHELAGTGAVLAMTLSLDEAAIVVDRYEPNITWGVGCHPRKLKPQEMFDALPGEISRLSYLKQALGSYSQKYLQRS